MNDHYSVKKCVSGLWQFVHNQLSSSSKRCGLGAVQSQPMKDMLVESSFLAMLEEGPTLQDKSEITYYHMQLNDTLMKGFINYPEKECLLQFHKRVTCG